jgi:BirA family biotin operon repressor/biotin-[acetyl-CoA-carboxylase] ligase
MDFHPDWPFVRQLIHRSETTSTSDLARRLVEDGDLALPALVLADRQTQGRGQGTNAWWSDGGSLTTTLILDPVAHSLTLAHGPRVPLAVATAIVDAIQVVVPRCPTGIRWPNDVEAGGRKLGGILVERVESTRGARLLIGIGLNVTTDLASAPLELRGLAASLAEWTGPRDAVDSRNALLRAILERIPEVLERLVDRDMGLVARWNELDLLANSRVRLRVGDEVIQATGAGIDELGGLRLDDGGVVQTHYAGRVLRD